MNGDFLCNKGRYAFDFANSDERITQPLIRQANGTLKAVSWEEALSFAGEAAERDSRHAREARASAWIGGNRLTNEEAYLLQKFARIGVADEQYRSSSDGGLCGVRAGSIGDGSKGRAASMHDTLNGQGGAAGGWRSDEPASR